eukprot:SAG25_NODE_288_length_10343_cov_3.673858_10_plen_240_part_00
MHCLHAGPQPCSVLCLTLPPCVQPQVGKGGSHAARAARGQEGGNCAAGKLRALPVPRKRPVLLTSRHSVQYDEGHGDRHYGHCVVAGIDRYPLKITKGMEKKKLEKRSKLKPFLKIVNYNHVMPTRCAPMTGCTNRGAAAIAGGYGDQRTGDYFSGGRRFATRGEGSYERQLTALLVICDNRYSIPSGEMADIKDAVKTDVLTGENPDEKKEAAKAVRTAMMARFQEGKNRWFFSKLRF